MARSSHWCPTQPGITMRLSCRFPASRIGRLLSKGQFWCQLTSKLKAS